nr:immunoglobulin heavy chain junction region [Mus musculus]
CARHDYGGFAYW